MKRYKISFKKVITFLFPNKCSLCSKLMANNYAVCPSCAEKLTKQQLNKQLNHDYFDEFVPLFYYKDDIRQLLINFKFKSFYNLKYYFAAALKDTLQSYINDGYAIVAAPTSNRNSSFLALLSYLNHKGFKINKYLIKKSNKEQKGLNRAERLEAIKGTIKLKVNKVPKKIVLLDDILTTGATCNECVKLLYKMGASKIAVVVLAYDIA
ncbi:MAG: hypothetical protein FWE37_07780 [Spirochaetaceae bacterium]|nr:hypothetical protein [Spirochaetaceae bacterium]